jgi:hypothetical protein
MNTIKDFFCDVTEPRDSNKRHELLDIITIALCAVICGADSWEDIEEFGNTKKEWFETFLQLPTVSPLTTLLHGSLRAWTRKSSKRPFSGG